MNAIVNIILAVQMLTALGMIGLGLKPVELFALDDDAKDCPAAP